MGSLYLIVVAGTRCHCRSEPLEHLTDCYFNCTLSPWDLKYWNICSRFAPFCPKSRSQNVRFNSEKRCYGQLSHCSSFWYAVKFLCLVSCLQSLQILSIG